MRYWKNSDDSQDPDDMCIDVHLKGKKVNDDE